MTILDLGTGIINAAGPLPLTFDAYRALPGLNFSALRHVATSPLHYRHARGTAETADTPALRVGRYLHALLTGEPVRAEEPAIVYEGERRGNAWKAFAAEHAGEKIVTRKEADRLAAEPDRAADMAEAILNWRDENGKKIARYILEGARFEQAIQWTHAETGQLCKARIDAIESLKFTGGIVLSELKTTRSIKPAAFSREVETRLYYAQIGMYAAGVEAVVGAWPSAWSIVVENIPPHDVVVYRVPDELLVPGWRAVEGWIRAVDAAERSGVWHGVAGGKVLDLERSAWAQVGEDVVGLDGLETVTEEDES